MIQCLSLEIILFTQFKMYSKTSLKIYINRKYFKEKNIFDYNQQNFNFIFYT